MKMMRILVSIIALESTAMERPTESEYQDDVINHLTTVRGNRIRHEVVVGNDISVGTAILYDSSLPLTQRLCFTPKGKLYHYTCPAVPGVRGLEKPRSMGCAPQYLPTSSATQIEVLSATSNLGLPVLAGLYQPVGSVTIRPTVQGGQRIDTKRLTCTTGQNNGMTISIEYRETMHHIPFSIDFTGGYLTRSNPAHSAPSACFTLSCWYLPSTVSQDGKLKNIFSWSYAASESEFKGKTKKLQLGITNAVSKVTSKLSIVTPKVVETTQEKTIKTAAVTKNIPASTIPAKYEKKEVEVKIHTPSELYQIQRKKLTKTGLTPQEATLAQCGKLPGVRYVRSNQIGGGFNRFKHQYFKTTNVLVSPAKPVPARVVIITPAKETKVKEIVKNLADETKNSSDLSSSASKWMHLVLQVNAQNKQGSLYCDNKKILDFTNPYMISLNSACTLQLGDHKLGLIANVILANGQMYAPEAFGCLNSQQQWIPKKFTGIFGTNGFHLAADTAGFSADSSASNSHWQVQSNPSRVAKSPTTL